MAIFVRDKSFYRTLLAIALPIALQNLISFGVSMLDTIMLGALGDIALSGSSLANQPTFIYQVLVFGIASGASVLTSQYWGKRDMNAIQLIFGMALKVTVVFSVLVSLLMFLFPELIMSIYTSEQPVVEAGVEYMRLIAFANLLMGVSSILSMLMRSLEIVKLALMTAILSLITNGIGNYLFIFGFPALGIPAMGIRGAAIATIIARACELILVLLYVFVFEKNVKLRLRKMLPNNKALWKDFFTYSAPVVVNELMWSVGTSLQAIVIGHLGMELVSANSISGIAQQLATIFIWGIANSAAVIIGKTVGAGKGELAKQYAKTLQVFCIILGFVAAGIVLLVKDFVIDIYNVSEQAKIYAGELMLCTALIVFFVSYTAPTLVGILRGGGDIRFVMFLDLACIWLLVTPLGFMAAFWWGLPSWLVFLLMKSDEAIKSFIAFFRLRSGKWVKNVTREITS